MLLIGFIIRIYHDAQSSECQNEKLSLPYSLMEISNFNAETLHFKLSKEVDHEHG